MEASDLESSLPCSHLTQNGHSEIKASSDEKPSLLRETINRHSTTGQGASLGSVFSIFRPDG